MPADQTSTRSSASPPLHQTHIPALDGLRGLAFAMVFLFHFGSRRDEHHGLVWALYYRLTDFCEHGVEVFFVLSGFLITGILLDTCSRADRYSRFYVRRTFRIFPLYYAVLVFVFVILRPFAHSWLGYDEIAHDQAWYWFYLENWKMAVSGWPHFELLDPFWSLAVEEQFYLFWPFVVFAAHRRGVVAIAGVMIVFSLVLRAVIIYGIPGHVLFARLSTLARLDGLAMGALIAAVLRGQDGPALVKRWGAAIGAVAAVAVLALMARKEPWNDSSDFGHVVGVSAVSALAAGVIAIAATPGARGPVVTFLSTLPLRALGKISYGGYVFHLPVLLVVGGRIREVMPRGGLRALVTFCVCAAVTLALSTASWLCFEQPVLRLRSRFER